MKKLIAIASLAIVFAAFGAAQTTPPTGGVPPVANLPTGHAKHPIVAALEKLNLSGNQKTQIEGMLKQRASDDRAFRKANKGNKPAIKAHNKQETEALLKNIKGVLTPAQWQQFESNLKALKGKGIRNSNTGSTGGNSSPAKP
jgi:Spy/CpxP family protein refolding chaperone